MHILNEKAHLVSPFTNEEVVIPISEFDLETGCLVARGFSLPVERYPQLEKAWYECYPDGKPTITPEYPKEEIPQDTSIKSTYDYCLETIESRTYESKDWMFQNLDTFLVNNRLYRSQYDELFAKLKEQN